MKRDYVIEGVLKDASYAEVAKLEAELATVEKDNPGFKVGRFSPAGKKRKPAAGKPAKAPGHGAG